VLYVARGGIEPPTFSMAWGRQRSMTYGEFVRRGRAERDESPTLASSSARIELTMGVLAVHAAYLHLGVRI
jgi:hypothetical protein